MNCVDFVEDHPFKFCRRVNENSRQFIARFMTEKAGQTSVEAENVADMLTNPQRAEELHEVMKMVKQQRNNKRADHV